MWYFLDYNPEPKIFKVTDQTKKLYGDAIKIKEELFEIFYDEPLKNENSIIDFVEIKSSSVFTDILWDYLFQGEIKIVSKKVIEILKEYKIYNVKKYKTNVKKGNEIKEYFSLRGYGEILEFIDFNTSEFDWYKKDIKRSEIVRFPNFKSYIEKRKEVGKKGDNIHPFKIYLNDNFFIKELDLIPLGKLDPCSFLISEKLKDRLESEELIGFEFKLCKFIMN